MFGVRVAELLDFERNVLFIPRFDRLDTEAGVVRIGMESLCSLSNVAGFSVHLPHEKICSAISRHCSQPKKELEEYIRRDVLKQNLQPSSS